MTTPAKFAIGICLAAGIFLAGYVANRQPAPAASSASNRQVLYYTCPMHPQIRSDHPGDAPCCGMRMVPVYAGEVNKPAGEIADLPGMVQISAARQQLIGVRTDEVKSAPASHSLRVPGRITVDDSRLYRIIAATDGWIRELGRNPAGTFVKKDEKLAAIYAQNFQAAQQALLYSMTTTDLKRGEAAVASQRVPIALNLQIAIDTLRGLGMSDRQIDEIQQTRQYMPEIYIYSPITGFVLARNVSPEQRFDKGAELYRIADIGHVWVMTDIFEKDRGFLKPGDRATVLYRGRQFEARMSDALPQFDPQTRTLKTRFELDNPGYVLRPDMFVDVEAEVSLPPAVTVPADAVIDSGLRKTVYIQSPDGFFAPRLVETGWRLGDRVQVLKGLDPGERIVVAGNFLIDSESRMRQAASSAAPSRPAAAAAKDPVCGMEVDPKAKDAIKAEYRGNAYYFCSDHCKKSFEADPEKYLKKSADQAGNPAASDGGQS